MADEKEIKTTEEQSVVTSEAPTLKKRGRKSSTNKEATKTTANVKKPGGKPKAETAKVAKTTTKKSAPKATAKTKKVTKVTKTAPKKAAKTSKGNVTGRTPLLIKGSTADTKEAKAIQKLEGEVRVLKTEVKELKSIIEKFKKALK